jgi:DNA-binding transcriptional MerR regulator
MRSSLAIGDFARATHLSIKTLRHYHRVGLLEPADVDRRTGYRYYAADQIPTAQVIRRFRALDMPLEEIQAVLAAPDPGSRNDLIAAHLDRLEQGLARTQQAVASLRDLLASPSRVAPVDVERRGVAETSAAAIREVLDAKDSLPWYQGALGELYGTLAAQDVPIAGTAGGVFSNDLFTHERGEATIFVPTGVEVRPMGRVVPVVVPGVELATTVHDGPHTDIDRAYGALGAYVTRHELAVEGPIREYYLVGQRETADESRWRTEIGWPIFRTGAAN